jgi:DNA polymerase-3 subunit delta
MPIIILAGEEEFEIAQKAQALKAKLVDPTYQSFNFSKLTNAEIRDIIDAACTLPFGPGNKVILIDKCSLFTKKRGSSEDNNTNKAKDRSNKLLEDLDAACSKIANNTYLIFTCTAKFDSSLKISKILAKHAKIEEFAKKKYYVGGANRELVTWCHKEAHNYNAIIEDAAVNYLAESTEANLRLMSLEIQKAATYALPDNKITYKLLSTISPHTSQVFSLLDNYVFGKKQELLQSISEVIERQNAIPIIALLQTTLSKWISLKVAVEQYIMSLPKQGNATRQNIPPQELAKRLALQLHANAFILEMDLKRIQNFSLEKLMKKKQHITDIEQKVKSGLMPEKHALIMFFQN